MSGGRVEDPTLVAVLVAVALGHRSPGDATQALFGGAGPVNERAVLIAACHLLRDLAEAYSGTVWDRRPADVLTDLAAGELPLAGPPAEERSPMPPGLCSVPTSVEEIATALRCDYRDAVRLSAREELLADLADDPVTAALHADTGRFHHGSAHAYAQAISLIRLFRGEEESAVVDVHGDKAQVKLATSETDLAPMRCHGRRYRPFDPEPADGPGLDRSPLP